MEAERIERPGTVAYAFTCADCGDRVIHAVRNHCTTGYAHTRDGKLICFRCCGRRDRQAMIETGHSRNLPLYLGRITHPGGSYNYVVSNWPGTLKFKCAAGSRDSRTNWGHKRVDFWFIGPDGYWWHGYQIGDYNSIAHCRRTKDQIQTTA